MKKMVLNGICFTNVIFLEFNDMMGWQFKTSCTHNQSKYLELPRQLIFLIYVANLNDLIGCVCKIILDYQPTTINSYFYSIYVDTFLILNKIVLSSWTWLSWYGQCIIYARPEVQTPTITKKIKYFYFCFEKLFSAHTIIIYELLTLFYEQYTHLENNQVFLYN